MAEKSFLDRAGEIAYKELERVGGDPSKLDIPLQTVAILYTVQAVIDNGGFAYLFGNDFPFSPSYSTFSDAYRRIGADLAAERIDQAVAMFPFNSPNLHKQKRNEFMNSLGEDHTFFALGDEVCGDEMIWTQMEEYAKQHAAAFQLA